ncbi:MAG: uroporphyrinogen-III synthase [bacterium]
MSGRTILVTRDESPDGPLATALRRHGATVELLPVIETRPEENGRRAFAAALAKTGQGDWLLVTSARACEGLPPVPDTVRVGAVGPGTAAAFERRAGRAPDLVGDGGGEALARLVRREAGAALAGRTVLWPASDRADHAAIAELEGAGARVRVFATYEVAARSGARDELASRFGRAGLDAVVVTSPSAARVLADAGRGCRLPPIAAIGGTTADALRRAGLTAGIVPDAPGFEALAEALDQFFSAGP